MSRSYGGIEQTDLERAVRDGLEAYSEMAAEGGFRLIHPGACDLNFADYNQYLTAGLLSSHTTLTSYSVSTGVQLEVAVLAPGEGTGRFGALSTADCSYGLYPETYRVIPPPRAPGTLEAAIAIASFVPEGRVLHANRLEAVGLVGHTVVQMAEIGENGPDFHLAMLGEIAVAPRVTMTLSGDERQRPRLGPWALFNNTRCTQIFGLVHTTGSGTRPREIFDYLAAETPSVLATETASVR